MDCGALAARQAQALSRIQAELRLSSQVQRMVHHKWDMIYRAELMPVHTEACSASTHRQRVALELSYEHKPQLVHRQSNTTPALSCVIGLHGQCGWEGLGRHLGAA